MVRLDLIPSIVIASFYVQNFIIQVDGVDKDDNDDADVSDEDDNFSTFRWIRSPISVIQKNPQCIYVVTIITL
jgi:hypothetical protein